MSIDHHDDISSDRKLFIAVGINVLLTIAQIVGGILSASLSLIADALHNLSDATALLIALWARKISRRPYDELKTFGYHRAETIAALINTTALLLICVYLMQEAVWRVIDPQPVIGWLVVWIAGIALIIDTITALLVYKESHNNLNMKAAFLHNLADALSSIGVLVAGTLIILFELYWADAIVTIFISVFILWHVCKLLPKTIHFLMNGVPEHLSIEEIKQATIELLEVDAIHHVHIWSIDEQKIALEAHIVVQADELTKVEVIKDKLKALLRDRFSITHSTLEFEHYRKTSCSDAYRQS